MPEEKSINGGVLNPAIITQDDEFNKFLMTLPENQRQTPESKYYTYKMWKISGKPKDFNQAVDIGLYHWNDTDKSYHGNSVIYDEESDVYHFLKPKDHSTVQYELDWYNNGVTTDDNGNQYELAGDSRVEWEDFRRNYYLDSSGDDYAYRRRPTLGVSDKARNNIMASLENGVKAALQNKLSSINQSLQESRVNKFSSGGPSEPLYYDNTPIEPAVVKAFNSDEEYNRYYGEQLGKHVAEGMNNAAPYVLDALMLPFTISGAVETPMLLYQGAKALPQAVKLGKSVFRKGKKYFGKKVLGMVDDMNGYVKEGSHFRIVDKPAIDDAIESGLIRAKTGLHHDAVTYLKNNFSDYLEDIPGWDRMDANDLRGILENKGAFNSGGDALRREAMIQIRNSTNHGGSVHYFKDIPYPNYEITPTNYVIETPENIGSFVAGHGGKEFVDMPLENAGPTLLKTNGSVRGASIPTKGSSYWEYSPFFEMWKSNKFDDGGNTEDRGKLRLLLEHIAELGTFVPATPMGVYLDTISRRGKKTSEPKDTEDTAVETPAYEHKDWMDSYSREDFEDYVNSPERKFNWVLQGFNGWSKEDLDYLYSRLGDTGWDPKALAYAISGETNFRPYVRNSASSAIGLAQLTKAQMETLFGKDNWQNVYNSYVDKTRPVRDIIDDTIKQYKWMHDRIKTEPDSMGYGRLKINLLAPNSGLDSKISDIIFKNSLTGSQKDKLAQGDSTYRDLMKMYDDEFNEHFTK